MEKALPVRFVEDGYDFAAATYTRMVGDFFDLQALDGHGNVVLGDVVRRGLGSVIVEDVRCQPRQPREVRAVVGVGTRFAANHRHSTGGVCTRHVVWEVEVKKLCGQRAPVRGRFCRGGGE